MDLYDFNDRIADSKWLPRVSMAHGDFLSNESSTDFCGFNDLILTSR